MDPKPFIWLLLLSHVLRITTLDKPQGNTQLSAAEALSHQPIM